MTDEIHVNAELNGGLVLPQAASGTTVVIRNNSASVLEVRGMSGVGVRSEVFIKRTANGWDAVERVLAERE